MIFADVSMPGWVQIVVMGILIPLATWYLDYRAKSRAARVETKIDINTEKTEKTYTTVNGRDESKPENPRGLTGMMEELIKQFKEHEKLDTGRHNDNLEVQKEAAEGAKAQAEATEKLRHKLFGG